MPTGHFGKVRMVVTKSMVAATFAQGRSRFDFGKEAEGMVGGIEGRIVEGIDTEAKVSREVGMGSNRVKNIEAFGFQFDQIRIGYNLVIAMVLPDNYSFATSP